MTETSKIPSAQQQLDAGRTQEQVAAGLGISDRTLRRWFKQGKLTKRGPHQPGLTDVGVLPPLPVEVQYRKSWTPQELLALGTSPHTVEPILLLLETATRQGNWRLHEYISRRGQALEKSKEPPFDEWLALVAFFPIVGRDILAPSLATFANVVESTCPWSDPKLRRRYHREAAPIMARVLGEVARWAIPAGLVVIPPQGQPKEFESWEAMASDTGEGIRQDQEQRLAFGEKAKMLTLLPDQRYQTGVGNRLQRTPYGIVAEIIKRLPDVDRLPRRLLRRAPKLHQMAISWCMDVDDEWAAMAGDLVEADEWFLKD